MSKVKTLVQESMTVTKAVPLSNGGFVELETREGANGYLKVHVSGHDTRGYGVSQAWRWIQHDGNRKNVKTLRELRDACDAILKSLDTV